VLRRRLLQLKPKEEPICLFRVRRVDKYWGCSDYIVLQVGNYTERRIAASNQERAIIKAELAAIAGLSSVGKSGLPFIEYRAS
jgi:hypothetical protein